MCAVRLILGLALFAGLGELLIALNVLTIGHLDMAAAPEALVYLAALGYLTGGLVILPRSRGMLFVGTLINAMLMIAYTNFSPNQPISELFAGGLVTKAAQTVLEAVLIYMILAAWQKAAPARR